MVFFCISMCNIIISSEKHWRHTPVEVESRARARAFAISYCARAIYSSAYHARTGGCGSSTVRAKQAKSLVSSPSPSPGKGLSLDLHVDTVAMKSESPAAW